MSESLERLESSERPEGLKGEESQERGAAVTEGRRSLSGVTAAGAEPPKGPKPSETGGAPESELPGKVAGTAPEVAAESAERVTGMVGEAAGAGVSSEWSGEKDAQVVRASMGGKRRKGRRLALPKDTTSTRLTAEQRLLLLDTWQRSGLTAGEFASLIGMSKHTLYAWKKRFEEEGPAGLMDEPRKKRGEVSVPEVTRRSILMLKESHPEYGCERISDLLMRGPGLPASASTVGRVLRESGYELEEVETRPHEPVVKRFERARPNQLWQTDLFTFALRRQNRRVYAVAFMDDHSRFVTGFGVHGSASTAMVLEVLRSAVASYGAPAELLTDNGPQYVTWRGTSAFKKECERLGIRQIVARPKHPQTLGKVERFWGTLWRELVETALFLDLADAKQRIAFFIDHYNFHRPHQGLDGLVPADRFFEAAPQVRETLKARVRENALELAKAGAPRKPFYLTGQMGGQPFTLHAEGDRFYLTHENGRREEVALAGPAGGEGWGTAAIEEIGEGEDVPGTACPKEPSKELGHETPAPPGTSPLDEGLRQLAQSLAKGPASEGAAQSRKEVES